MSTSTRLALERGMGVIRAFAKWSHDCRTDLGNVSQTTVGEGAGVSQGAVSRIESGKCKAIALVTYVAVHNFYRELAEAQGVVLAAPPSLLHDPHEWTGPPVDPARVAWLRVWDSAAPRTRAILAAVCGSILVTARASPFDPVDAEPSRAADDAPQAAAE